MDLTQQFKQFLSHVDIEEFLDKVDSFKKLDLATISDEDLFQAVNHVITFKTESGNIASLPTVLAAYPKGTKLYRVRLIDKDDTVIPLKGMRKEQDAWNAPNHLIKVRGRLNNVNESLLYVSPGDPDVAIKELKIKENDSFSLMVYTAKEDIKVNLIGTYMNNPSLTSEENTKLRLIMNFLRDEFTKDVGKGTEFLYRVSERIVKDYFDLPPRVVQDAWCYPSIAKKDSCNVCFRPEVARDILELDGVIICQKNKQSFTCKFIATISDNNELFQYYPIGSPMQKRIFPQIEIS
jgi:hypothetical protein